MKQSLGGTRREGKKRYGLGADLGFALEKEGLLLSSVTEGGE